MPALIPTQHVAKIVWLGVVPRSEPQRLPAEPLQEMPLTFAGYEAEAHSGATRPSCSRVMSQHPRGTEIANARQLSVVCADELAMVADEMGLDEIDPRWLGASLVLQGIPDFTFVPPSSRLQGPDGVTIVVDMENRPCILPGRVIEEIEPGAGKLFKPAAKDRRGVTAWVERPGTLRIGDEMRLHVPNQRGWKG